MQVTLTITIDSMTGAIDVQGPSLPDGQFNLGLCYSMLELARDVMRDRTKAVQQAVVPAQGDDISRFGKQKAARGQ